MTTMMRDRFDEEDEDWKPEDGELYPPLAQESFPQRGSQDFARMLLEHLQATKEQQNMQAAQMKKHALAQAILPAAEEAANGLGTIRGVKPQSSGFQRYFDTLQKARAAQEAQQLKGSQINVDVLKYLEGLKQKREMMGDQLASRERMMGARQDQKQTDRERMLEDRRKLEDYKADIQAGLIDRRHNLESPSAVSHEDLYAPFVKPGQNPPKQGMTEERRMKEPEERPSGRKLGKAQEVADKEFAQKVVAPFLYEGKYAQDLSAINDLRNAIKVLDFDPSIGGSEGLIDEKLRGFLKPLAQDVKDNVENAVKQSLKSILGGQFTEKEGQRIFALAYNPVLPMEINKKRIEKLIKSLSRQFDAKMKAAKYFEKYQTLEGFKGSNNLSNQSVIEDMESGLEKEPELKELKNPPPNPDLKIKGKNKEIVKKLRNKKTGEIKVVYSDGSEEIVK